MCCCYVCVYFHRDLKIKIPKVNSSFQNDLYKKQEIIFLNPVNSCHESVWEWQDGGTGDEGAQRSLRLLCSRATAEEGGSSVCGCLRLPHTMERQGYGKGHTGFLQEVEFSTRPALTWHHPFILAFSGEGFSSDSGTSAHTTHEHVYMYTHTCAHASWT